MKIKEQLDSIIFDVSELPAARMLVKALQARGATVAMRMSTKASPNRCVYDAIIGTTKLALVGLKRWHEVTAKNFKCCPSRESSLLWGTLDRWLQGSRSTFTKRVILIKSSFQEA